MKKITLDLFLAKSKTAIGGLFVLVAFLLMNAQTSWGQTTYNLVTSTDDLTVGAKYLIVSRNTAGSGFAVGYQNTNSRPQAAVTVTSLLTISTTPATLNTQTTTPFEFTLGGSSGAWTLTDAVNGGSLYAAGVSSNNYLRNSSNAATAGTWTITFSSGAAVMTSSPGTATTRPLLRYNSGSSLFSCYTSGQAAVYLYKMAASVVTPPSLTPDSSSNTVDNNIDITFTDDATWRAAVTAVKVGATTLTPTTDYVLSAGNLQLKPSGSNALLTASGSKSITVVATGYSDATATQVINAGAPTGTNSTATISAALAPNLTRTITCTAKDQYNNLVSGYTFGYDVTVTNNTGTTTESYTIDGSPFTATDISGNPVTATTNASGVATFTAALPTTIDPSDGLSIQVQLADDTTNVGSAFSFAQLGAQTITFDALTPVTYGDTTFDLTATASSTLPVTYTSSNTAVATVSGNTVTIVGAGSTDITASQAGDSSFNAAENVIQALTVNAKALTLPDAVAASRVYNSLLTTDITGTLTGFINGDDVNVTLDGTLKGTFADANVADGIAVIAVCTLAGTKAGNYTLTQPTGLTANITQATQTITFATLTGKLVGDPTFELTGTSSSGLTVTYTSSNTAVATVSGTTVTIVGAGSTDITASQAGNGNYVAAADAVRTLTVIAPPLVAFDFTGKAGDEVSSISTSNATNMATSTITRGAGLTAGANADRFNASTWALTSIANAVTGNDYMEFTVAPNSGYQFAVSSILFNIQRSGTGLRGIALRSSVDNYATNLDAEKAVADITTNQSFTFNFSQANTTSPVTYRLYGFAEADGGSGGFEGSGNDIVVTGTTEVATSTAWSGTAWTNGTPIASLDAFIEGDLTTTVSFTAKSLTVNSGKTVTVATGTSVTVENALVNNGTITVENNANLRQTAVANTNSGSGTATVKRNSAALKRLDYTMWSSPVSGSQTLEGFSPNTSRTPNRFYTYNGGTAFATIATTSTFDAGKGYLIRMPNDATNTPAAFVGQFTGTLNNGNITVSGLTFDKYYSVGNPYPSTLDAAAFLVANPGTLYFWRKTNGASGGAYATYNSVGPVAAGSGSGSDTPDGTIQVGQGFIAKTGVAANQLVFTNAMRLGTTTAQFFKTKNTAVKSRVWLDLTATGGVFSQALVGYLDGATLGIDNGYDGKYLNDSPADAALTSIVDGGEYTIQGRPAFDVTDVVALGFKTGTAGDYTIAINKKDGALAAQDIYLVDSKTGIETDLNAGSYTFNAAAGVDNTRFSLKYQKTLKVDAPAFNDNSVKVYKNNGAIYVNSTAKTIKTIEVYDVQGRLIAQQKNVNATTATIQNVKAIRQMLIVKVSADDNSVVTKKVMN